MYLLDTNILLELLLTLTPIEWGIQNININPLASSLNNKII